MASRFSIIKQELADIATGRIQVPKHHLAQRLSALRKRMKTLGKKHNICIMKGTIEGRPFTYYLTDVYDEEMNDFAQLIKADKNYQYEIFKPGKIIFDDGHY